MALTIATGFVVDDAIVVIENITRHIGAGTAAPGGRFEWSDEIGFTVLSISISLIAVFLPIFLMGGIVGRLVPGICSHSLGGHLSFRSCLAHDDSHDVCAVAPPAQRR